MSNSVGERVRLRRSASFGNRAILHQKLIEKQRVLRRNKLLELQDLFRQGNLAFDKSSNVVKNFSQYVSYFHTGEFPPNVKINKVYIDSKMNTVLLPIFNQHIPVHIKMIKNVYSQKDDSLNILKLTFVTPSGNNSSSNDRLLPNLSNEPNSMFIKEITLKSKSSDFMHISKEIRKLIKDFKFKEESEETQQSDDKIQKLELNFSTNRTILRSLMIKFIGSPNRKSIGHLEAHLNGFRYSAPRLEPVDLLYNNIEHCFFLPLGKELIIILHFELFNPIMINKKKISTIQFYHECGSKVDEVETNVNFRRSYDTDEILDEQRENERRKKTNEEFKKFIESFKSLTEDCFSVEIPNRKMTFSGVPKNSTVDIMPTRTCLVSLAEWPVLVLNLKNVELVSFERVVHGVRNFDLIFVNKNYSKPVNAINNIPVENMDMIKKWLNDLDIVWYEGKNNLNWHDILKYTRSNIKQFIDEGGFNSFLGDDPDIKSEVKENEEDLSNSDKEDEDYVEINSDNESKDLSSESESADSAEHSKSSSRNDEEVRENEEEDDEEDDDEDDDEDDEEIDSDASGDDDENSEDDEDIEQEEVDDDESDERDQEMDDKVKRTRLSDKNSKIRRKN